MTDVFEVDIIELSKAKKQKEIAKKLLKMGMKIEEVSEATGLNLEEIKDL